MPLCLFIAFFIIFYRSKKDGDKNRKMGRREDVVALPILQSIVVKKEGTVHLRVVKSNIDQWKASSIHREWELGW